MSLGSSKVSGGGRKYAIHPSPSPTRIPSTSTSTTSILTSNTPVQNDDTSSSSILKMLRLMRIQNPTKISQLPTEQALGSVHDRDERSFMVPRSSRKESSKSRNNETTQINPLFNPHPLSYPTAHESQKPRRKLLHSGSVSVSPHPPANKSQSKQSVSPNKTVRHYRILIPVHQPSVVRKRLASPIFKNSSVLPLTGGKPRKAKKPRGKLKKPTLV